MPTRAPGRCTTPGCPGTPARGQSRCAACRSKAQHAHDQRRGSARERGYTTAWDRRAKAFLRTHPVCVDCGAVATVADHAPRSRRALIAAGVPDPDDEAHLQARCKHCHDRRGARSDEGTFGRH